MKVVSLLAFLGVLDSLYILLHGLDPNMALFDFKRINPVAEVPYAINADN